MSPKKETMSKVIFIFQNIFQKVFRGKKSPSFPIFWPGALRSSFSVAMPRVPGCARSCQMRLPEALHIKRSVAASWRTWWARTRAVDPYAETNGQTKQQGHYGSYNMSNDGNHYPVITSKIKIERLL